MFRVSNVVAVVDHPKPRHNRHPRSNKSWTSTQFYFIFGFVLAVAIAGASAIQSHIRRVFVQTAPAEDPQANCTSRAVILPHLTSINSHPQDPPSHPFHSAHILLHEDVNFGNFFFGGSTGRVAIAFLEPLLVSHLQIDVSTIPHYVPTPFSPRKFVIWSSTSRQQESSLSRLSHRVFPEAANQEFFEVSRFDFDHTMSKNLISIFEGGAIETEVIVVEILDNWGGSATCLHRIRFWCK